MIQDVRYALRGFVKNRGFTTVAVLTLALGIGATTAIFSVVNAVLLRPLPGRGSDRLVRLYENVPPETPDGRTRRLPGMNVRELLEVRARSRTLSHVVANGFAMVTAACPMGAVRLFGTPVSASAFPMLGVQPAIGRWFEDSEEAAGRDHVIVLSDAAWTRCFDRASDVVGKTVTFTGRAPGGLGGTVPLDVPFTVVGVMAARFRFPGSDAQFWTPLAVAPRPDGRPLRTSMMAKLAEGATVDAAVAELSAIVREVRGATSPFDPRRFELVRVRDETVAPVKPALRVLTGAVAFVLLIACANAANLLLARAAGRSREMAIRAALGAGRVRLLRQTLTESLLLSLTGGAVGTALAFAGVRLFHVLGTRLPRFDLAGGAAFPRLDEIAVDRSVLLFVLAVSAVTGALFGLAPALRLPATPDAEALRGSAAFASGFRLRSGRRVQGLLVVAQIAMATLVFVAAALLLRSFVNLTRVDPGYDAANVLTFQIAMPGERTPAELSAFAEAVAAGVRSLPGVEATGYANQLPMVGLRDTAGGLHRTADPQRRPAPGGPDARFISRGYLEAMGVHLIAGRSLADGDGAGAPRVLLMNQALARNEFPGENPIGQRVFIGRGVEPYEVIGIVADVRQFSLDREPEPQFFVDVRQWPASGPPMFPGGAYYAVRTSAAPTGSVAAIRAAVAQVDAHATLDNIATMERLVSNSVTEPRLYAALVGTFAAVAVALAAIGVYGVVAYAVSQRTREIGIRVALGAARSDVLRLVLRQGAQLTVVGLALGIGGAAAATRSLQSLLFGVTPLDPWMFAAVAIAFGGMAMVASFVPARRATAIDPLEALRTE
jgi:putative ABC transport system permease protein